MLALEFDSGWLNFIMKCIQSTSCSFTISGFPSDHVNLNRGLHKGDLISRFLFLIFFKGLSLFPSHPMES